MGFWALVITVVVVVVVGFWVCGCFGCNCCGFFSGMEGPALMECAMALACMWVSILCGSAPFLGAKAL